MVQPSAFQRLFQPDCYQKQYQDEHDGCSSHTTWRRTRTPKANKSAPVNAVASPASTRTLSKNIAGDSTPTPSATLADTQQPTQPPIMVEKSKSRHIIELTEPGGGEYAGEGNTKTTQEYCSLVEEYQKSCQSLGIATLDQAAGATASEPRWGSVDDPVAAIHATVTWNGSPRSTNDNVNTSLNAHSCEKRQSTGQDK